MILRQALWLFIPEAPAIALLLSMKQKIRMVKAFSNLLKVIHLLSLFIY